MTSIFLSYAREDRGFAEMLARLLEESGHSVWWDRRLHSGEEFSAEIEAAIGAADIVLVAWSRASVKSRWVRDEASFGGDNGCLVPVSIDGSLAPMGFRQFHTLDLSGWRASRKDPRTVEILRSLEQRANRTGPPAAVAVLPPKRRLGSFLLGRRWAVAAAVLLVIAAGAALLILRGSRAEAEPASLAVLPFKNMAAGDPYFAEGVAEEIADQLSREPQFKVAGRTSSALFKDAADLRDVGRRLRVAYVLEGSVRSAGKQVRVDVALVDTGEGHRLWNQDFRGNLDDIFAIQDQIGQQVAAHVKRQLVKQAPARGATTTRGDVYSLYLTARSLMNLREPAKIVAAVDLLKRAVKLDPNYGPAWAQLALATQLSEFYGHEDDPDYRRSEEEQLGYARRAIALAPTLAEAHSILGLILISNDKLDATMVHDGRREIEKAVRLDPNDAMAWYWLGELRLTNLEFEGALNAIKRTAAIDPFFIFSEKYAFRAWTMGDQRDAARFMEDRIANHPDPFVREMTRSYLAAHQNDLSSSYEHAKAAAAKASTDQAPLAREQMGSILIDLGLFDQAKEYVPANILEMFRGHFPPNSRDFLPRRPLDFWLVDDQNPRMWPRLAIAQGYSRELLALYDGAFSSPEDMASRYSHLELVEFAPLLAIALHRSGRDAEGLRFLVIANRMCQSAITAGRTPTPFRARCSRLWAVMGRNEQAIAMLQQIFAEGWRPSEGEAATLAAEPAYARIRGDPRLDKMERLLAAERGRERRELLAAGL